LQDGSRSAEDHPRVAEHLSGLGEDPSERETDFAEDPSSGHETDFAEDPSGHETEFTEDLPELS
jgi:hypothetical protein